MKLRLESALRKEHLFSTLGGNLSLYPPASRPHNLFFNTRY
jgi:hypothetical protein